MGDGCVASFEYSDSQIIIKETIMKYHCIVRYAFLLCALVGVQGLRAQLFQSVSVEEIPVAGMEFSRPVSFMPDGHSLLLTSATQAGLWLYDVEEQQISQFTDALGAGSEPVVSADGNTVIHRTVSFSAAHQRLTALDVVDVSARRTERLLHPQRQVPAYRFSGNTAMALSPAGDMVYKVRGVAQADACQMPMVSLDFFAPDTPLTLLVIWRLLISTGSTLNAGWMDTGPRTPIETPSASPPFLKANTWPKLRTSSQVWQATFA